MFTQIKENAALIKKIGPMYIYFDDYRPYSDTISDFFKQMLMLILSLIVLMLIIQAKRKCTHGLMRKVGK